MAMIRPPVYFLDGDKHDAWNAGYNARHNLFRIKIWRGIDHMPAVLAQELCEWRFLHGHGLMVAAPLLALSWLDPAFIFAALLAFMLIPRAWSREMELLGHMVEVEAAVRLGADFDGKVAEEVRSLTHYRQFRRWDAAQITSAMLNQRTKANRWLDRHWNAVLSLTD